MAVLMSCFPRAGGRGQGGAGLAKKLSPFPKFAFGFTVLNCSAVPLSCPGPSHLLPQLLTVTQQLPAALMPLSFGGT